MTEDKNRNSKERLHFIDACKAIAIVLVVETHAREMSGTNTSHFFLKSLFYSIDRNGVLLFLICSGFLLLRYPPRDYRAIIKRSFFFYLSLAFFSIITNTVMLREGLGFSSAFITSIKDFNFIFSSDFGKAIHLWFLKYFIPVYFVMNFLVMPIANTSTNALIAICLALFVAGPVSGFIIFFDGGAYIKHDAQYFFTVALYMVIGCLLYRLKEAANKISACKLISSLVILVFSNVLMTVLSEKNAINENAWRAFGSYEASPILVGTATIIFVLIMKTKNKPSSILGLLSKYSFGVYLIHYPVMFVLSKLITLPSSYTFKLMQSLLLASISIPLTVLLVMISIRIGLKKIVT